MRSEYIERLKTIKDLVESKELDKAKLEIDNLAKDMSSYKKQKHDKAYDNIKKIRKASGCPIYGRSDDIKAKRICKELQKIKEMQDIDMQKAFIQYKTIEYWGDALGTKWLDYIIEKAIEIEIDIEIIQGVLC